MVEGTGRFIVFADDDFIARKRWVLNLVRNMANANVICCTGRMISHRQDETSELFERSLGFDKGQKKRLFSRRDISLSSLFVSVRAIRGRLGGDAPVPWCVGNGYFSLVREAVNTVGSFDESLGVGTPSRGGEEVDMFYRILKSGRTIVYDPEAVIYHDHRPNYFTLKTAAYNAGASERAFASKYFGTDLYCTIFFLGALSLRVLQFIMNAVKQRRAVSDLELLKLCGFLHVPRNGI
jgi:GT2 family glycosyltransferase